MIDKVLTGLKYVTIAALYIVFLFGGHVMWSQSHKDTEELKQRYSLTTKNEYNYTGYIVRKYRYKGVPTIEVVGYGRFVISEEEFKQLDVGTMVPDYIAMRSQNGKTKEKLKTIKKDQTK